MALKDLVVTHNQARAMRIIYRWLRDRSGRNEADVLRDLIAAELRRHGCPGGAAVSALGDTHPGVRDVHGPAAGIRHEVLRLREARIAELVPGDAVGIRELYRDGRGLVPLPRLD